MKSCRLQFLAFDNSSVGVYRPPVSQSSTGKAMNRTGVAAEQQLVEIGKKARFSVKTATLIFGQAAKPHNLVFDLSHVSNAYLN